jgi:hypothetical protein
MNKIFDDADQTLSSSESHSTDRCNFLTFLRAEMICRFSEHVFNPTHLIFPGKLSRRPASVDDVDHVLQPVDARISLAQEGDLSSD